MLPTITVTTVTEGLGMLTLDFTVDDGGDPISLIEMDVNGAGYVNSGVLFSPLFVTGLAGNVPTTVSLRVWNSLGASLVPETVTGTPSFAPTPTPTPTSSPTPTPSPTETPVPTTSPTETPIPTSTPVPTLTPVPTQSATPTPTPTETLPPTPTPMPTATVAPTPTPRATSSVIPVGYDRGGTNFNTSVVTYEDLSIRLQRQLGAPLINLEISDEQIYDNITDSIEYFTKWAGYTEEYLIFDSKLYVPGVGIKLDDLASKTPELRKSTTPGLSAGYDYDLASLRKIIDCFEFSKGEDTGINTLFTMEQAMAQQIYSSYMVGNFGFDLVTWEVLKGFIDTRNKVLAMTPHFRFDPRSQVLRIIPEPQENHTFLGIVGCYIERPIKDVIRERWVQKYALALTKISIARVREKFTGTNLMGGGSVNGQNILAEGLKEKEALEQELMNSYQDNTPPTFFIG
jgi:hypothetical protein